VKRDSGKAWLRLGAVMIDLLLAGGVIYIGWTAGIAIVVYLDQAIRTYVLGLNPLADLTGLQNQREDYPVIVGRPELASVLSFAGPAAMTLLYLGLMRRAWGGRSAGEILMGVQGGRARPRQVSAAELKPLGREFARKVSDRFIQTALDYFNIESVRKAFGGIKNLLTPVKALPGGVRLIGWITMGLVIAFSVATPLWLVKGVHFATVPFTDVDGIQRTIPRAALYLALAGVAIGWAAALTGASLSSLVLLAYTGVFYVFGFAWIGLAGGRSRWLVLPQWALPVIAAGSPVGRHRRKGKFITVLVFCVIATLHTTRMTPLHDVALGSWIWLRGWPAIAPVSLVAAIVLTRLAADLSAAMIFTGVTALNIGFLALALRAGEPVVAGRLYNSLYQMMYFLTPFWFLLGGNLVDASIRGARATVAQTRRLLGPRWISAVLTAACIGELFLIAELYKSSSVKLITKLIGNRAVQVALGAHEGIALALLAAAAVMAAGGWLTLRRAGWLLALWTFSLLMTVAYFAASLSIFGNEPGGRMLQRVTTAVSDVAELSAIALLTFTIVFELVKGRRRLEGDGPLSMPPQLVCWYFGIFTLLVGQTDFGIASATVTPDTTAAYAYCGMQVLVLPMVAYAVLMETRQASSRMMAAMLRAGFAGMMLSLVPDLMRVALGDPSKVALGWDVAVAGVGTGTVLLCTALLVLLSNKVQKLEAALIGAACALGFAAGYVTEGVAPILGQLIGVPSVLLGFRPGERLVVAWLHGTSTSLIPEADAVIFFVLVPAMAAATGLAVFLASRTGKTIIGLIVPLAALAASVAYTAAFYRNEMLRTALAGC
jgi:hypothetical protein